MGQHIRSLSSCKSCKCKTAFSNHIYHSLPADYYKRWRDCGRTDTELINQEIKYPFRSWEKLFWGQQYTDVEYRNPSHGWLSSWGYSALYCLGRNIGWQFNGSHRFFVPSKQTSSCWRHDGICGASISLREPKSSFRRHFNIGRGDLLTLFLIPPGHNVLMPFTILLLQNTWDFLLFLLHGLLWSDPNALMLLQIQRILYFRHSTTQVLHL